MARVKSGKTCTAKYCAIRHSKSLLNGSYQSYQFAILSFLLCRPPVSRAAPLPEKLLKDNLTKKKKLVEVREMDLFLKGRLHS